MHQFLIRLELGIVWFSHLAIPWAAVALVGAAAHAIGPALDQTVSAALESVAVLDKVQPSP